ncbi:hypothetical protein [Roseimaritima sediminicola]|uniref:hypothetical protein n=1 Tax=Roseimaritima sediminicola TaxID=2662066 RepID=UPI00129829C8|nr:hypothetical protein [Roseimaritima sediminicola]
MKQLAGVPEWLPFAGLNLRHNPFGECAPRQRAELAVVSLDRWLAVLEGPQPALQFVGDCGRGKSTHLLAMRYALPDAAYVYFPEQGPLPSVPEGAVVLIDEAQRMPCRVRRTTLRRRVPLVLGTHVDLRRVLRRYGYAVHTVRVDTLIDAPSLTRIFNRRLEAARLDDRRAVPRIATSEAARLHGRFGSDVRAMEEYLYERFQRYAGKDCVEVSFVD